MKHLQEGKKLIFRLLLLMLCAVGVLTGCVQLEEELIDRGSGYQDLVLIEDDEESDEGADAPEGLQESGTAEDGEKSSSDEVSSDYGTDSQDVIIGGDTEAAVTEAAVTTAESSKRETTAAAKPSKKPTKVKETTAAADKGISEKGTYTSPEEVAEYIHRYRHLPSNYITKRDAEDLGWSSSRGNLWDVAYGKSIGGSRFGNYEGALPEKSGRKWYECDVNYEGGYRGAERLLYSNDGLIYYTNDHYETFTKLY